MDISNPLDVSPSHLHSIQALQAKIVRAKKRIQEEQHRRDDNVEEYLKMAAVAQRNQLPQVKLLFEKRNTKAATHIAALQRKLERYQENLKELEAQSLKMSSPKHVFRINVNSPEGCPIGSEASGSSNASSHRTSKGRLQHVGHGIKSVSGNLKDGITGISGTVISKPKEIASYLLKQKFGSADNIPSSVGREGGAPHSHISHGGSALLHPHEPAHPVTHSGTKEGAVGGLSGEEEKREGSECSESQQSSSLGHHEIKNGPDIAQIFQQLVEIRDEISAMREDLENFKIQTSGDTSFMCQGLQEERFRAERLEEQVNDLTELHQAETGNLKQALADAEEKLSYQSEERLRDLAEMLDACQAKISRLEQQQQQLVTIEGIENSAARALAVKLVNVGLTMLQLLLLIVATAASALSPFLGSRVRLFVSLFVGVFLFVAHRKWPQAQQALVDLWADFISQ